MKEISTLRVFDLKSGVLRVVKWLFRYAKVALFDP